MIDRAKLTNFRNFEKLDLMLSPGISILYGQNAQGKTNFLEALNYLSTLKSYRQVADKDLIRWGQGFAILEGFKGVHEIHVIIQESKKEAKVDGIGRRVWEAVGEFKTVIFSPEDIALVTGNPSLRRRFLDILIAKTDRHYVWSLLRLKEVLRNRNRVLFNIKSGYKNDLSAWDDQLADLCIDIWRKRQQAIEFFNHHLAQAVSEVGLPNPLRVEYGSVNKILTEKDRFLTELKNVYSLEVRRAATLLGPHRDDFVCIEEKGGRAVDLALYGSRGEQRSFLIALKVSEVDYIAYQTGERPTLLLDDILSELDANHREILFDFSVRQQTLLTSAVLDIIPAVLKTNAHVYEVDNAMFSLTS